MAFTTRFAPSPTGRLHKGHAFSALTAWQAAHDAGGRGDAAAGVGQGDADLARTDVEPDQPRVTWQPGEVGRLANPGLLARDGHSPPK